MTTVNHDAHRNRTHGSSSHRSEKSHNSGRSSNKSPDNTTTTTTKVAEDAIKVSNSAEEDYGVKLYAFGEQPFIDLKKRVETLEAEKAKIEAQKKSIEKEKETLEDRFGKNIASQKRQIETLEKTIADLSTKALQVQSTNTKNEEAGEISTGPEEKIGVLWPTVDHLKTIMVVQEPIFTAYRSLGKDINGLRNSSKNLETASSGLKNEDIEIQLKPKEKTYKELADKKIELLPAVEAAKKNLEKIIAAATFLEIPEYHQKSFSCKQKLSMEKIKFTTAKYEEALAACIVELELFKADIDNVRDRFFDAAGHINRLGSRLDTTSYKHYLPGYRPALRVQVPTELVG